MVPPVRIRVRLLPQSTARAVLTDRAGLRPAGLILWYNRAYLSSLKEQA